MLSAKSRKTARTNRHRTEKSIQNSQTFHKPLQYSMEKQHKGTQLFCTSGKGGQPLLEPMVDALHQSKLIASVFFVISHGNYYFLTTVQSWEMQFLTDKLIVFPSALKTTKFTNFHRPHSFFTDFQSLEKLIPFFPNFQRPSKTV